MNTSRLLTLRPSRPGKFGLRRPMALVATLAALTLTVAACGSSKPSASSTTTTTEKPLTGSVDVLYAGSLVDLMTNLVGPDLQTATGVSLVGTSGDSGSLANEIKGKVIAGDVFISASAKKDAVLQGAANGNWVTWYVTFASSPLVIGYNAKSKFAADLQSKPWYDVVGQSGFLLGRTDPTTDPKGQLSVEALNDAATQHGQSALSSLATATNNVFAENTLVGRLQAGQLDAGFFYAVEAKAAGIPTVSLPGSTLAAHYTMTILANAAHQPQAVAFIQYLLSSRGAAELAKAGLTISRPLQVTGQAPSDLTNTLY